MLEHEAQRTQRGMILGKLVMVEVSLVRLVRSAHIHHRDGGIGEVSAGGFPPDDWGGASGQQRAAGEKLVFVRASGVGQNQ